MADRITQILIGIGIDQNSAKNTAGFLKKYLSMTAQEQSAFAQGQIKLSGDVKNAALKNGKAIAAAAALGAKRQGQGELQLSAETFRQLQARQAATERAAQAKTRIEQAEQRKQQTALDARARYEYQSGQKSQVQYLAWLNERGKAEESFTRKLQILQEKQRVEKPRSSIAGGNIGATLAGGIVSAASLYGSGQAVRADIEMANRLADKASDLNEARDKNRLIFRDAAKDIDAWAEHADNALGLTKTKAIDAAATIGNLLRAAGINGPAGADLAKKLVTRAVDIGSVNNIEPAQALEKLISGINGKAQPLRAVGVFLSEARVKAEAFAEGIAKPIKNAPAIAAAHKAVEIAAFKAAEATKKFGAGSVEATAASLALDRANTRLEKAVAGSTRELTEQQKIQARIALIMKDSAIQAGNFADTSDQVANAQRRWNAQLENLEIALGDKVLPLKKEMLSFLNDMLSKFNSLDESTKNFSLSAAAIGAVAVPMAAGVTNIVAQLLRIKQAYLDIKGAQKGVNLNPTPEAPTATAGTPFNAPAQAAQRGSGLFGTAETGFFTSAGAAVAPLIGPALVVGGITALGMGIDKQTRDEAARNKALPPRERIKFLQGQIADWQKQVDTIRSARAGTSDGYVASMQDDPPAVKDYLQKQSANEKEIAGLKSGLAQVAAHNKRMMDAAAKVKADEAKAKTGAGATTPGASTGGTSGLYSGASMLAGLRQAQRERDKADKEKLTKGHLIAEAAQRVKAQQDAEDHQARQDEADAHALQAKAVKEGRETAYNAAMNALDTLPDEKQVDELLAGGKSPEDFKAAIEDKIGGAEKTLRDISKRMLDEDLARVAAVYNDAMTQKDGENDYAWMARAYKAESVATQNTAVAQKQYQARDERTDKLVEQAKKRLAGGLTDEAKASSERTRKGIEQLNQFLQSENRMLGVEMKDAEDRHDFAKQEALIRQKAQNETSQAGYDLYHGVVGNDPVLVAKALTDIAEAGQNAAIGLRAVQKAGREYAESYGPKNEGLIELRKQVNLWAHGPDRFFVDSAGNTRDRKRVDAKNGVPVKVDSFQVDMLEGLTDAAKRDSAEFLRALFSGGEKGRNALKDLGKNLGRDLGDTLADSLHHKLIDSQINKAFDYLGDQLGKKISAGGASAGLSIAQGALALYDASLLLGKGGKKKQKNALLGAVVGGIAGSFAGQPLLGAEIGAGIAGSFATGGLPPLGRRVLTGELGPELAISGNRAMIVGEYRPQIATFNQPTRIIPADQTAAMLRGGGGGSSVVNNFNGPLVHSSVDTIHDRADADRLEGRLLDHLTDYLYRG